MIDAHPALVAVAPQAPVTDYYMGDDSYHNGAFFLAANFGFYANFGKSKTEPALPDTSTPRFEFKNPNGYDFYLRAGPLANLNEKYLKHQSPYWSEQLAHTNYDVILLLDEFDEVLHGLEPRIFLNMRALKDRYNDRLVYIIATVQRAIPHSNAPTPRRASNGTTSRANNSCVLSTCHCSSPPK